MGLNMILPLIGGLAVCGIFGAVVLMKKRTAYLGPVKEELQKEKMWLRRGEYNAAMVKGRQNLELLLKLVAEKNGIQLDNTAQAVANAREEDERQSQNARGKRGGRRKEKKIMTHQQFNRWLADNGYLDRVAKWEMNQVRLIGNKAVHENYADKEDAWNQYNYLEDILKTVIEKSQNPKKHQERKDAKKAEHGQKHQNGEKKQNGQKRKNGEKKQDASVKPEKKKTAQPTKQAKAAEPVKPEVSGEESGEAKRKRRRRKRKPAGAATEKQSAVAASSELVVEKDVKQLEKKRPEKKQEKDVSAEPTKTVKVEEPVKPEASGEESVEAKKKHRRRRKRKPAGAATENQSAAAEAAKVEEAVKPEVSDEESGEAKKRRRRRKRKSAGVATENQGASAEAAKGEEPVKPEVSGEEGGEAKRKHHRRRRRRPHTKAANGSAANTIVPEDKNESI